MRSCEVRARSSITFGCPSWRERVYAAFVRSTTAHARIKSIDTSDAAALDGVLGVFTASDLNVWPLPPRLPIMNKAMVRPMLANGVVRFVGEPIAVVLAASAAIAADALEYVVVDYDELPVITQLNDSLTDNALLHPDAGTNVSLRWTQPEFETDEFGACDVVVNLTMRHAATQPWPYRTVGWRVGVGCRRTDSPRGYARSARRGRST